MKLYSSKGKLFYLIYHSFYLIAMSTFHHFFDNGILKMNKYQQMYLPIIFKTSTKRSGSYRTKEGIKEALKKAFDSCLFDREEIAKELSRLVGEDISIHTINNWIAEGKTNRRVPLEYIAALTAITGDNEIIKAAINNAGLHILNDKEMQFFELRKIIVEEKVRKKRKKQVMEQIGLKV